MWDKNTGSFPTEVAKQRCISFFMEGVLAICFIIKPTVELSRKNTSQLELPKYHMCDKSSCHVQCCSYVEMFILKLNKCSTKFDLSVKGSAPVTHFLCDLLAKKLVIVILVTQMSYC